MCIRDSRVPALRGPGRGVSDITEPVRRSEGEDCASRPAKASCIRIGCSRTRGRFTAPHNVCGVWPAVRALGPVRCPMWGYSECGRSRKYKTKQNKTNPNPPLFSSQGRRHELSIILGRERMRWGAEGANADISALRSSEKHATIYAGTIRARTRARARV